MPVEFPHRANPDGTIDSICARCYATIGNAHWESELERMEADHICDPVRLSHFDEVRRMGAKLPPVIESSPRGRVIKRVG